MKENIKMKKEELSFTEKDYTQLMAEYKATDKDGKKLRKEDKAIWIESKCKRPKLLQPKTMYKVVKELATPMTPVMKPDCTMASTHAEHL